MTEKGAYMYKITLSLEIVLSCWKGPPKWFGPIKCISISYDITNEWLCSPWLTFTHGVPYFPVHFWMTLAVSLS